MWKAIYAINVAFV